MNFWRFWCTRSFLLKGSEMKASVLIKGFSKRPLQSLWKSHVLILNIAQKVLQCFTEDVEFTRFHQLSDQCVNRAQSQVTYWKVRLISAGAADVTGHQKVCDFSRIAENIFTVSWLNLDDWCVNDRNVPHLFAGVWTVSQPDGVKSVFHSKCTTSVI